MYKILNYSEELSLIGREIDRIGAELTILEAGCGRRWPIKLSTSYRLIGIDQDEEALIARVQEVGDLESYQLSDLREASIETKSIDVIYCSYVLEHVVGVNRVLENFARWVRPNGLIIIRVPDGRSVYGFLARFTPHWLHVAVKKYVYGMKNAGKVGHDPYPVVYESAIRHSALADYCERHNFSISATANCTYIGRRWWLKPFVISLSLLSLGRLDWRHNNLTFIIRT